MRLKLLRVALSGVVVAACGGSGMIGPAALQFVSVSAGGHQSCGVSATADAYCWGGLLGNGTTNGSTTPILLSGLAFSAVSAGASHTCGLTPAGEAFCWGTNVAGPLGDGTTTNSWTPVPVSGGLRFAALTAGGVHTCGLTATGAAYCWGRNDKGELGSGTSSGPQICGGLFACSMTPAAVSGGLTFVALSAGERHTCGVTRANVAYCWGYNFDGELGAGTTTGPQSCGSDPCSTTPVAVTGGLALAAISAGFLHTCGVTTAGTAYCWGNGSAGRDSVRSGLTFTMVSAGTYHTCGVTVAGAAYCWGVNSSGQLGSGDTTFRSNPVPVSGGLVFSAVSAGGIHSCGVTRGKTAYCWGSNADGQLGDGTKTASSVPVVVGY